MPGSGGHGAWLCASNMPVRRLQGGDLESKHGSGSPHCLRPSSASREHRSV